MRLPPSVSLSMFQVVAIAVPVALQLTLMLVLVTQRLEAVDGVGVDSSDYQHLYSDSFSRNDEFDMMALEPETPFGTPYGGYSRATASRLAALPLKLPSVGKEVQGSVDSTAFEPMYTTVRDNFGRAFACRVYHEDELEAYSLGDSMFDTPILKKKSNSNSNSNINTPSSSNQEEEQNQKQGDEKNIPVDPSVKNNESVQAGVDSTATSTTVSSSSSPKLENLQINAHTHVDNRDGYKKESKTLLSETGLNPIMLGHTIHQRFVKLTGLCAQLHPDWWSYEWCHQETVKQFHVKLSKQGNDKVQKFELEGITSLGSYSGRTIEVATKDDKNSDDDDDDDNDDDTNTYKADDTIDLSQERKEIGRVVDTFIGGGICPETGKPRVTEATFRCCSERYIAKTKGGVLKNGKKVDTDIVTVFQATEWKGAVCHYNITLCTPLLCDDYDDDHGTSNSATKTTDTKSNALSALEKLLKKNTETSKNNKQLNLQLDPAEAEKMSVVEILERTFGKAGNFCVRSETGGWWAYEFCPGDYIRQYHKEETSLVDQISGITTTQKKGTTPGITEHVLGRFVPEDHKGVIKENEWEHVVNATSSSLGGSKFKSSSKNSNDNNKNNHKSPSAPSTNAGGNGAYYFQEYTKGDLCDHEDVTDSAIKAGEFGEGGIERAITVRYSCNSELTISVKEDSTCHYVVDITVPTLCHHPLFKPPVSKKQVVKCLPIT